MSVAFVFQHTLSLTQTHPHVIQTCTYLVSKPESRILVQVWACRYGSHHLLNLENWVNSRSGYLSKTAALMIFSQGATVFDSQPWQLQRVIAACLYSSLDMDRPRITPRGGFKVCVTRSKKCVVFSKIDFFCFLGDFLHISPLSMLLAWLFTSICMLVLSTCGWNCINQWQSRCNTMMFDCCDSIMCLSVLLALLEITTYSNCVYCVPEGL